MATWSDWFHEAKKIDFRLDTSLSIHLEEDQARLYASRLPVLDSLLIDGARQDRAQILDFCNKHQLYWVRAQHKRERGKRYYRLELETSEVLSFMRWLPEDIAQYNIQIYEYVHNQFGGNIIADEHRTVIEIVQGTQEIVSKPYLSSRNKIYHGFISPTGCLTYHEKIVPLRVRLAAWSTLNHLKLSRGEYLHGYFEFIVSNKNQTFFLDYKTLFLAPPQGTAKNISSE